MPQIVSAPPSHDEGVTPASSPLERETISRPAHLKEPLVLFLSVRVSMRLLSSLRLILLLTLLGAGVAPPAEAQLTLPPQTIGDVMDEAQANETPILLEVYAPWCPYCQRMQETVYADSTVRAYLDRHFTYARLNSDTTAGTHRYANRALSTSELASVLGGRGVPVTVFLKPDGTPIARQPGLIKRPQFLEMIRYVGSGAYRDQSFQSFRDQQSD